MGPVLSRFSTAARVAGLYAVLSVVLYLDLLLPGGHLFRWDAWTYAFPLVLEAREQVLSGQWPFWAPSFCSGTPLLANINAALLYPLKWMLFVLPISFGFALYLALHTWLSLCGVHFLIRKGLRLATPAAVFGALMYALCGYARGMCDTMNVNALPWIPMGLTMLLLARDRKRVPVATLGFAGSVAMLVLGGDVQAAFLFGAAALSLSLVQAHRAHACLVLLAGGGLGVLLSAPQWIPTAFVAGESYRAGGLPFAEATELSFHPARCLEFLWPHAFGTHETWNAPELMGAGATKLMPWTASVHVGRLGLLVALLGLVRAGRSRLMLWVTVLTLLSLLLSLGRFLPGFELVHQLPGLSSFRYPEKYLLWTSLGLSLMGACAFAPVLAGVTSRTGHVRGLRTAVLGLLLLDLGVAWFMERPSSRAVDPAQVPLVAQHIRESNAPYGRFVRDPAMRIMLPTQDPAPLRPDEQLALWYRAHLAYNSPRRFGIRSADGFSPLERAASREQRMQALAPDAGEAPELQRKRFTDFCKANAVRWVLTSGEHAHGLGDALLAREAKTWGASGEIVLLEVPLAGEVTLEEQAVAVIRLTPGTMRIDFRAASSDSILHVKETYDAGWQAMDQNGRSLAVDAHPQGTGMHVAVPHGTTQVRMRYRARGWDAGAWCFLLGVMLGLAGAVRCVGRVRVGAWVQRRGVATALTCLIVVIVGCLARSHWACTFDEAFHTTRGVVRVARDDSRLSYFHPPLQNMTGGYVGTLAHGSRLSFPDSPDWHNADLFQYATSLAAANPRTFPSLAKSARWGTTLYFLLLVAICAWWGGCAAGPWGAWLCGLGIGLNPNLLAHGNLTTTDMGVLALAFAGTFFVWAAHRRHAAQMLSLATLCFAASAMVKFTGLIWLFAHLVFVIPAWACRTRSVRPLMQWGLAGISFGLLLLVAYGLEPQLIRAPAIEWLHGREWIGGRYVEGIVVQGQHAFSGHRGFFLGEQFMEGRWWYLPVGMIIKSPALWLLAGVWGLICWLKPRRHWQCWLAWLPVLLYLGMTVFANQLAIGVRHILPLTVVGVMAGAISCARLRNTRTRRVVCSVLMAGTLITASMSYPHYLSYFPAWVGGTHNGYRHLVDSNFDWGQDIERLEREWAALTLANGGQPPHLVYYGFLDPEHIYGMPMAKPSLRGFMDRTVRLRRGEDAFNQWVETLSSIDGTTAFSLSAMQLEPFGMDASALRDSSELIRIGKTIRVAQVGESDQ